MEWLIVGAVSAGASVILLVLWAWRIAQRWTPEDHYQGSPFADVTVDEDADGLRVSGKIRVSHPAQDMRAFLAQHQFTPDSDTDGRRWEGQDPNEVPIPYRLPPG